MHDTLTGSCSAPFNCCRPSWIAGTLPRCCPVLAEQHHLLHPQKTSAERPAGMPPPMMMPRPPMMMPPRPMMPPMPAPLPPVRPRPPTQAMARALAEVAKTTVVYVGKIASSLPDVSCGRQACLLRSRWISAARCTVTAGLRLLVCCFVAGCM